ncbi:hypothetical protein FD27_GL001214 [Limosilactobacillus frumenti DSM 13145]|uniref:Uncharacterized protein n=1 Tax=Limosilactobacillus frumenti DSM 13145 TaxID=1423746 RepID=A0A0R1PFE7_9LACO|nr:hypothetical protein FD27_GL001214 [Limosilactobacillus frumenti DSM 13145]
MGMSLTACGNGDHSSKLSNLKSEHSRLLKKEKQLKQHKHRHARRIKSQSVKPSNSQSNRQKSKSQSVKQSTQQNSNGNQVAKDDSSAYYSSLQKANDDYWRNLSPQEKQEWSQWADGESRANDPYQNGYYNSTQPSSVDEPAK